MQNTILASLEFYFKGIRHDLSAVIELDRCMRHGEPLVHIYQTLAAENGIGMYSHEFDVMVMEQIIFSEPHGLATEHFRDGKLDLEGLQAAWQQQRIVSTLQPIAQRHLGIDELDEHPALKAALLEAYQAD